MKKIHYVGPDDHLQSFTVDDDTVRKISSRLNGPSKGGRADKKNYGLIAVVKWLLENKPGLKAKTYWNHIKLRYGSYDGEDDKREDLIIGNYGAHHRKTDHMLIIVDGENEIPVAFKTFQRYLYNQKNTSNKK